MWDAIVDGENPETAFTYRAGRQRSRARRQSIGKEIGMLTCEKAAMVALQPDGVVHRRRAREFDMPHYCGRFVHDAVAALPQPETVIHVLVVRGRVSLVESA